jgi:hypothetical protein
MKVLQARFLLEHAPNLGAILSFHMINQLIALVMEAARTPETSVNFYQTTRHNNPEDSHLHTRSP